LNRIDVGRAAQAACVLEAISAKPGNVNRLFDFADTTLADFLLSAVMIGHCMETADRNSVGETVFTAVQATKRIVTRNTNLGIILLLAPMAKAYGSGDLRTAIRRVLESLTVRDAVLVSRAIRLAGPGGLGRVEE
jgi:triphosphoribosyl-dephospho-CoA synthase